MIPYNPSSFDRNKTILEQILELKNWLKDHPSYRVFVSNENGNTAFGDTYDLNEIVDDPTELGTGDVVLFKNGCVGSVSSVDLDAYTFDCNEPCVNMKGPQGPSGQNGVSVTGATIDGSGHLIVTLSNGNTIDAGMAKGADGTNGTNGTNGTDGKYISNVTVDGNGDLICTIYDPETSTSTQVNAGYVVGPAGQGMQVINTTTLTGTLSASDLAKANGTDDCILIYTDNGVDLTMQRIMRDSSNVYFYSHFIDTGTAVCSICEVNAVTGAYTISGGDLPIKAGNIDSETATNGQVLTADGSGGASWQNAGGGSTIYEHRIRIYYTGNSYKKVQILLTIYDTSSTAYDMTSLQTYFQTKYWHTYVSANGYIESSIGSGKYYPIFQLDWWSSLELAYINLDTQAFTTESVLVSNWQFNDKVNQIS